MREWVGQICVAILVYQVHKSLPLTGVEVKADSVGRYVMIKGTLFRDTVSYLNVYAPPSVLQTFLLKCFPCSQIGLLKPLYCW